MPTPFAAPQGLGVGYEMDEHGGIVREINLSPSSLSPDERGAISPEDVAASSFFRLSYLPPKGAASRFVEARRKDAFQTPEEKERAQKAGPGNLAVLAKDPAFPAAVSALNRHELTAQELRVILEDPAFQKNSPFLKFLTDDFDLAKTYEGDPDEYYLKQAVLKLLKEERAAVLAYRFAELDAAQKSGQLSKKQVKHLKGLAEEESRLAYERRFAAVDLPSESLAWAVMKSLMVPYGIVKPLLSGPLFIGGAYLLSHFVPGFYAPGEMLSSGVSVPDFWGMLQPDPYRLAVQGALSTVGVGLLVAGTRDIFKNSPWLMGALDLTRRGRALGFLSPATDGVKDYIAARQPKFDVPENAAPWVHRATDAYKYSYLAFNHGFVSVEQSLNKASEIRSLKSAENGLPDEEKLERLQKIKAALIAGGKTPLVGGFLKSMGTILPGTRGEMNSFSASLFGLNMMAVVLMSGVAEPVTEALRYGVERYVFNDSEAALKLSAAVIGAQILKSMAIGVVAWTPGCLANLYINKHFTALHPDDPDKAKQDAAAFRQKYTLVAYSTIVGAEVAAIHPGWQLAVNLIGGVGALYGLTQYLRMPEGALPAADAAPPPSAEATRQAAAQTAQRDAWYYSREYS